MQVYIAGLGDINRFLGMNGEFSQSPLITIHSQVKLLHVVNDLLHSMKLSLVKVTLVYR